MRAATPADVLSGAARWCVVEGDALALLASLPDGCVDALLREISARFGISITHAQRLTARGA